MRIFIVNDNGDEIDVTDGVKVKKILIPERHA